jgi:hypothetical protein
MNAEQFISALSTFTSMANDLSEAGLNEIRNFLSCQEGRIAAIEYLDERLSKYEMSDSLLKHDKKWEPED